MSFTKVLTVPQYSGVLDQYALPVAGALAGGRMLYNAYTRASAPSGPSGHQGTTGNQEHFAANKSATKRKYFKRRCFRRRPFIPRPECKIFADSGSLNPTAGLWNTQELTQVIKGTTLSTRIGETIYAKGLEVRGKFVYNNACTASTVRVVIFRPRGSHPYVSTELPGNMNGRFPTKYQKFYHVLYDRIFDLAGGADHEVYFRHYMQIHRYLKWDADDNVCKYNPYYITVYTDNPDLNQHTLALNWQLNFLDV